jgi:diaminopimelate decarboxylase
MANSGSLITQIQDIVDTGKKGHKFLKINAGMTEVTRPSMYGAQHPLIVITKNKTSEKYIVVGHCCESGDMLTPQA